MCISYKKIERGMKDPKKDGSSLKRKLKKNGFCYKDEKNQYRNKNYGDLGNG